MQKDIWRQMHTTDATNLEKMHTTDATNLEI